MVSHEYIIQENFLFICQANCPERIKVCLGCVRYNTNTMLFDSCKQIKMKWKRIIKSFVLDGFTETLHLFMGSRKMKTKHSKS